MESIPRFSNWIKPDTLNEAGEIDRVASTLGLESKKIMEAIEKSPIVELDESSWSHLENTDSYDIKNLQDVERMANQVSRDYHSLVEAYNAGIPMEVPIILKHGVSLHLVSGNTRLMVARAINITPKVIICEI